LYGGQATRSTKTIGITIGNTVVDTFPTSSGQSSQYEYYLVKPSDNSTRTGVVMATWDTANVVWTEYSTPDLNGTTEAVDFRVVISSGNVQLRALITSGTWTVIVNRRIIF
jgi:hypothetical protein